MHYLTVAGKFDEAVARGGLSFRSERLKALSQAIDQYVQRRSRPNLQWVQLRLDNWKQQDPKEFADRGRPIEPQLRDEIKQHFISFGGREIPVVDPDSHPIYEPHRWNDGYVIQFSTNCYAYACNDPDRHRFLAKPQPGQLAGLPVGQMEHSAVRFHVMADDALRVKKLIPLIRLRDDPIPDNVVNVPGYYLIALVTAPGLDYHWVRQDANGMWSHKPGWSRATNLDSLGRPIYDPRDAAFTIEAEIAPGQIVNGKYEFSTFYYAPKGGVRTERLGIARRFSNGDIRAGLLGMARRLSV